MIKAFALGRPGVCFILCAGVKILSNGRTNISAGSDNVGSAKSG